jgi:methyl-accepting chemotaxis protein
MTVQAGLQSVEEISRQNAAAAQELAAMAEQLSAQASEVHRAVGYFRT